MTTDDTRPLHTDPVMAERCDGYCAGDECVCPDPTKSAAYKRLDARHAALVAAARSQHYRVENVTQDGDDWYGCLCGEANDDCAVLVALDADEADA